MSEDNTQKRKSVRIPCAKIVHDYTMTTLQRLGNLRCTDVYRSMKNNGGIVLQSQSKALRDIDKLLVCTDKFIPSVPMTSEDVEKTKTFITSWKKHLQQIRKNIMCTCKPVYLQTEVAKVLKERKAKVKFREVMLEWYLSQFGGDDLTPEKVADAVIAYNATDWSKVRPLAKGKNGYNIRLDVDTKEEQALALKHIQWIYKIETGDVDQNVGEVLSNDLQVMKEFEAWRDSEPKDYEYRQKYQEFISRLKSITTEISFGSDDITNDTNLPSHQSETPNYMTPETSVSTEHHSDEEDFERNYEKLMIFMMVQSEKLKYGNDINEPNNIANFKKFASRKDFNIVFETLQENIGECTRFGQAMQYIRNVVLENQIYWSTESARKI